MNVRTVFYVSLRYVFMVVCIGTIALCYGLTKQHDQTMSILLTIRNVLIIVGTLLLLLFVLIKGIQYRHTLRMMSEEHRAAIAERKRIEQETRVLSMDELVRKREAALKEHELYARNVELTMKQAQLALDMEVARIRLSLEQQQATLLKVNVSESLYHVSNGELRQIAQGQLPTRAASTKQQDIPALAMPYAPVFSAMHELIISRNHLVLAYTNSKPLYGTLEDHLLSMLFTGRPKTGKSTAILYYAAMFLKVGILPIILDPQGSLRELKGILPYRDSLQSIHDFLPVLYDEFREREELWRASNTLKPYAIVVIMDEFPMIAAWEEANVNKKTDEYSVIGMVQKVILEMRKLEVYMIAAGQGFPASIIPTLSRDNTSSRLIFPTTDRYARMAGLSEKHIQTLLPQLDAVERGTGILDISCVKEPYLVHLPYTTVTDVVNQINNNESYGEIIQQFSENTVLADTDKHTSIIQVNSKQQARTHYEQAILEALQTGYTGIREISRVTGISYNIVRPIYNDLATRGMLPISEQEEERVSS